MRTIHKILIPYCLFNLWFIFSSTLLKATAPTDSLKRNYALNDPRNSDCPCHKYQKMAEDEFKKSKGEKGISISLKSGKANGNIVGFTFRKFHFKTRNYLFRKGGRRVKKKGKMKNNLCYKF